MKLRIENHGVFVFFFKWTLFTFLTLFHTHNHRFYVSPSTGTCMLSMLLSLWPLDWTDVSTCGGSMSASRLPHETQQESFSWMAEKLSQSSIFILP